MSFFERAAFYIVDDRLVYNGFNQLRVLRGDYTRSDGRVQSIEREVIDHGMAVGVLIYDSHKKSIILVRQFRAGVFCANGDRDGFFLEIPAGLIDEGDAEDAARREMLEETGYQAEKLEKIMEMVGSPGVLTEKVTLFAARVDLDKPHAKGGGLEEENEDIEIIEMGFEAAFQMVNDGFITDAKTIIALQWAALNRKSLFKD